MLEAAKCETFHGNVHQTQKFVSKNMFTLNSPPMQWSPQQIYSLPVLSSIHSICQPGVNVNVGSVLKLDAQCISQHLQFVAKSYF